MAKEISNAAYSIVDAIVSGKSSAEIRDEVRTGLYGAAMEGVETMRQIVYSDTIERAFDEETDPVTRNAKVAEKMAKVKDSAKQDYPDTAEKKRQNKELLKQGDKPEHEDWKVAANWKGQGEGAKGWMNPKGDPMRPWGGDRRPNAAGGPELPFDKGTVPNGSGV